MKRSHTRDAGEENSPLEISSLIDICFLLLIYFLVATTLQKKETDLPLAMPTIPDKSVDVPDSPLFIRLDVEGAVHVGAGDHAQVLDTDATSREVPLLLNTLRLYAAGIKAGQREPMVQLVVADGANQQRVVDVLNAFVAAEISNVAFDDFGNGARDR
jgi:biopolymer transport protein ExbD